MKYIPVLAVLSPDGKPLAIFSHKTASFDSLDEALAFAEEEKERVLAENGLEIMRDFVHPGVAVEGEEGLDGAEQDLKLTQTMFSKN